MPRVGTTKNVGARRIQASLRKSGDAFQSPTSNNNITAYSSMVTQPKYAGIASQSSTAKNMLS
jgi:hypothetical protein